MDIIDRLKRWYDGTNDYRTNDWGPELTADLKAAVAEIERLRRLAGAVSDGESFLDIRKASRAPPQAVEKPSDTE